MLNEYTQELKIRRLVLSIQFFVIFIYSLHSGIFYRVVNTPEAARNDLEMYGVSKGHLFDIFSYLKIIPEFWCRKLIFWYNKKHFLNTRNTLIFLYSKIILT